MNPAELNLNPITQLDPFVIIATAIIVIATFVALRRVFVAPYMRVMDERETVFETADRTHSEAEKVLRSADLEAEASLTSAAQAAEQLRVEARERSDAYRRTRIEEAGRSASEQLETGRAEIAATRAAELELLRTQAVECVGLACEQLLGDADAELVEASVDRLMTRRIQ